MSVVPGKVKNLEDVLSLIGRRIQRLDSVRLETCRQTVQ